MNVFKMNQKAFPSGEHPQAGGAASGSVTPKRQPKAWSPFTPSGHEDEDEYHDHQQKLLQ